MLRKRKFETPPEIEHEVALIDDLLHGVTAPFAASGKLLSYQYFLKQNKGNISLLNQ